MLALPPFGRPWPKIFFWISLIYMEILVFRFEGPISKNKGNKMFACLCFDGNIVDEWKLNNKKFKIYVEKEKQICLQKIG